MIFTIVGKPGGGKSFYSLRHIVNVLVNTENSVCTNLSVNIAELHAYLSAKYPDKGIDTPRRIRLLDVEQSRRFWLHRIDSNGMHVDLEGVTREDEKKGRNVDYERITGPNRDCLKAGQARVYPGIDYVIDECHVFFDARAWADTGLSLTYYNSQHRKLDDNVTFVTQFLELVDKRVKSFSQEFIYLRNNGAEKFLTFFRGPSYFTAKHYQRPPTGLQDMPSEVHRFTLDLPLAKCYDTSAGVGISGVGKPEAKRKKGLNVLWLIVPFGAFLFLLAVAPDWLASAVLQTDTGTYTAKGLGLVETKKPAPAAAGAEAPAKTETMAAPPLRTSDHVDREEPPHPVGYVVKGSKINVVMSDGKVYTEADKELERVERNSVTISGQKLFFRAAKRAVNEAPQPIVTPAAPEIEKPAPRSGASQSSWYVDADGVSRLTPEALSNKAYSIR